MIVRRLLMALGVALIVLLGTASQATAAPAASTTAARGSAAATASTLSASASKTVPRPNIWGTYGYYPDAYTCNAIGQYAVNTGQARAYDCYFNSVYPDPWVLNVDFS